MSNTLEILNEDTPSVIKNYLFLQDKIDLEVSKSLKNIFEKLDRFELREISMSSNQIINDGLIMIPAQKKENNLVSDKEKEKYKKYLINNIDDSVNAYYSKAFISLIDKINYIDASEQVILNYLFLEIGLENKRIEEFGKVQNEYMIR